MKVSSGSQALLPPPATGPDGDRTPKIEERSYDYKIDWVGSAPYWLLHLACFAVIWVGFSWTAFGVAVGLYVLRMHAITGWFHRYFSHRTFKTGRVMQFIWGFIGTTSVQHGPMWWAAHHRHHHRYSDKFEDHHSPRQRGFWWSHCLWFLSPQNSGTDFSKVPDLVKFPEIRWLDRHYVMVAVIFAVGVFGLGWLLEVAAPGLGTTRWQMLVWGFVISTVFLYHATYTINSLSHVFGKQRFETGEDSKNNPFLAILTLGEGWHNNHHHYQHATRQGFYWWEIDISFYILKVMSWLGLVWDLKAVPPKVLAEGRRRDASEPN